MPAATYQPQSSYNAQNPYTTKDRVVDYSTLKQPKVKQVVSQQPTIWGRTQAQTAAGGDWAVPKTINDGAQPRYSGFVQPGSNIGFDYGINREIGGYTKTEDDTLNRNLKGLYIEYMKRMAGNNGVNVEMTMLTNPKNILYNDERYTYNNYKPAEETVVTKDNVYTLPPKQISKIFSDVGTIVKNRKNELLKEKDNLSFDMRFEYIPDGEKRLKEINGKIQTLNYIDKKISLGIESGYDFIETDIAKLSEEDIYDMIYSKEYADNLLYTSDFARTTRAEGQGTKRVQAAVDIVDNIVIKNDKKGNFTISDAKNTNSGFSFKIESVLAPQGYTEARIAVNKNSIKQLDNVQYDLLKAMDNLKVPDDAKRLFEEFAENKNTGKANKALGATGQIIDVVDFMTVVASDYEDDSEIGTDSSKAVYGMLGSWAGDIAGGATGAKAGAAVGAVFGPVGVVIGGVLGAAFGAYVLSSVMEDIGRYMGEHIYDSDYTIGQYYERGK